MKKTKLIVTLALLSAPLAKADYFKLYSPNIVQGELAVEADLNQSFDSDPAKDKYLSQVYGFEYGMTSYWMTELSVEIEKEFEAPTLLTNVKWENVINPFAHGENWLDLGLYIEVEKSAQGPGPYNLELKLLAEKEFDQIVAMINVGGNRHFGALSNANIDGALAAQLRYRMEKRFEPGLEYYAEFGTLSKDSTAGVEPSEQSQRMGPVVKGKIGNVNYDVGALFALDTNAEDTTLKANIEYEF